VTDLRWRNERELVVGLTAAAGWLDALAFLYLGKVFASFMSADLLLFGIGAGRADRGLTLRAGAVLTAFLVATAARFRSPPRRTLLLEAGLLAAFALLWVATGNPADHATMTLVLLVLGAAAMGLQASVGGAFHLPSVAWVMLAAALRHLGALVGRRASLSRTPTVSLMLLLGLSYVVGAAVVAAIPETSALAFGPLVLLASAVVDARSADRR